jgi:hypothetical protein
VLRCPCNIEITAAVVLSLIVGAIYAFIEVEDRRRLSFLARLSWNQTFLMSGDLIEYSGVQLSQDTDMCCFKP